MHNVLWNFNGFDSTSTMAGEIEQPAKTIPRALVLSTLLVTLTYLLPVLVTTALDPDWRSYNDGHYTEVADRTAGVALTAVFSASATLSCAGMYMAELATDSYQLSGMAEMGLVPRVCAKRSRSHDTPWVAISTSYLLVLMLAALPFSKLLEVESWLYSAGLLLQLGALLRLRVKMPVLLRDPSTFKIPVGNKGLVCLYLPTVALALFSIFWCNWVTHAVCIAICLFGFGARLLWVRIKAKHPLY
eukprot:TRINITY_DN10183_c0_g1_i4.p1 TRINITY_DN10183_c0_g1~~TRINITY_DN10183_c0_g1_i4.p1  ORF type:complete len:245 (+),score=57.33 TRINITY_DN10183_c0_g1_i4:299-1033(+)